MITHNLGYPRIGSQRELKKACERYWAGKINQTELLDTAREIRQRHWQLQKEAGLSLIPCNDFSFYDQVLDMSLAVNAIPKRYQPLLEKNTSKLDLYFAMARGYQQDALDITAMEMTKWFDTNYHYIVPEFQKNQSFSLFSDKVLAEFREAKALLGKAAKPVLIGPVSYLLLGKEKEEGFHRIELLDQLLPVYVELIHQLQAEGAEWIQLDEPFLALDLSEKEKQGFAQAYDTLRKSNDTIKILLATYFEGVQENVSLATSLPVCTLHLDLVRAPQQLDKILQSMPEKLSLSLGIVDGRNIWKNNYEHALQYVQRAIKALGDDRVMLAPSCSLLHCPNDLDLETKLDAEIKSWMAFAKQKLHELHDLSEILGGNTGLLDENKKAIASRVASKRIHKQEIKQKVAALTEEDARRKSSFPERQAVQQECFNLPLFPTTTIGSFPQTADIRKLRRSLKKGDITPEAYEKQIEEATQELVQWQENIGLDVLVHGEFERNDMVEYFGELLDGFAFTQNGWVQSYGSRCVKPPVIFGDVSRPADMTVRWSKFAQSLTKKPMKGMLTGPVTILQWSFVRDDQPRSVTTNQIALAIREEAVALEKAGIGIIQIDEPAIREGLPLQKADWNGYLKWAVKAFRIAASGVGDSTQIHTHMCYSEFNDIIQAIADMDADVITMETSRSQMELLEAFADFKYPNEIGPGVYDIHSPRVPSVKEMVQLLEKAVTLLPARNIWVNPDCGLKTRKWPETEAALKNMVAAAAKAREHHQELTLA